MKNNWEPYNPSWLAELALKQIPHETEIISAIQKCTLIRWESKAYGHFTDPQDTENWKFERNILLHDQKNGEIVLDILSGNRIGGIEFLKRLK